MIAPARSWNTARLQRPEALWLLVAGCLLLAVLAWASWNYRLDLPGGDAYSVFPLQMGDGVYTVRVMEQVENDLYAMRYGTDIDVRLNDETLPFLYPNQLGVE